MSKQNKEKKTKLVRPLREQVEKIVEPRKRSTSDPLGGATDSHDSDLDSHVRLLADRIRKLGPLEPTDISTQEGALAALPILQQRHAEIEELQRTAEKLRQLLTDE